MKIKNTRRGFTLIELLVVVIIIAILAAIALPQYQKAVMKSRVAKIQTIMNTMDKVLSLYAEENGGGQGFSVDKLSIDISGMFDSCTEDRCSFDNGKMGIYVSGGFGGMEYGIVAYEGSQLGQFEVITRLYGRGFSYSCRDSLLDNRKAKPLCEMLQKFYPTMSIEEAGS